VIYSATATESIYADLAQHLLRADRQEDLTFAFWHPSRGRERFTGVVTEIVLPLAGDREVHGNVSFSPTYFERAIGLAAARGAGLAFLHAHPGGAGWQGLSRDDREAERGHAGAVFGATGRPFLGLTMAGDGHLAGRFWERVGPRAYEQRSCETVRVVGDALRLFFDDRLRPAPQIHETQIRTVSAWGPESQAVLARLRVGVVGTGNVGSIVAEILARTGVEDIRLIDFDSIELVNLDRTLGASRRDVRLARSKVETVARSIRRSTHSPRIRIDAIESSVVEDDGFRAVLDCDIIFSCVDRPWPRAVMNLIAYAHEIPVIDGGIIVRTRAGRRMLGADWRAHVAGPGRRCLECLGQYDPGLVSADREGYFDRPSYLAGLPPDHPIRRNENVFIFGVAAASLEALQLLSLVIAPAGISNVGAQMYHATTGELGVDRRPCERACLYSSREILGRGDDAGITVSGVHAPAEAERVRRSHRQHELSIRLRRLLARAGDALGTRLLG
jgi:hypothetical protein